MDLSSLGKILLIIGGIIIVLGLLVAGPVFAAGTDCPDMQPTLADLRNCVLHAADNGYIHNPGITADLLQKVDAAQTAVDHQAAKSAARILQAFIYSVQAQAGHQIDAEHAEHMAMHAREVIAALNATERLHIYGYAPLGTEQTASDARFNTILRYRFGFGPA